MTNERWLEALAGATGDEWQEPAPARLKSKTYSAMVTAMTQASALRDLRDTRQAGGRLCVFETAIAVLPVGPDIRSMNPCRICHARVLGERLEHAPIFWPGCPYSEFHNG